MAPRWSGIVVLLGLMALTAGCSAAGSLAMDPVNDTELADGASRSLEGLPPRPRGADQTPREIVRGAIENGSSTVRAPDPPVESELPFAYRGAYYNVSKTVIDRTEANMVTITVDYNTTSTNGTAIALEELPSVDRSALAALFPQPVPVEEGEEFGAGTVYTDTELNASVLAPVQQYDAVVVEGKRYAIDVGRVESVTVRTYRYTASLVARSPAAYAEQLRSTYAFELANLTEEQRSVVQTAIDEGSYYADSSDDEAFASLLRTIRPHAAIRRDRASGTWLIRYDGEVYLAEMHYGGFLGALTEANDTARTTG
jgi:hypothetical protein